MHVRCPLCRDRVQLDTVASFDDVTCPSCGSSFSLVSSDDTISHGPTAQETVAHFTLTKKLGVGAFGTVWEAQDSQLDRSVALKLPRKGQLDAEESEKFLREARAAAQLKHPNIVTVHEVGRDGGTIYIVSDLIEGLTITDWLTGYQPMPRESAELCEKIARALHHAHEQGVIHRDLKPGNVMIDRHGEPHLMDFGLAKREAGEITMTLDGQVLGTPAYMSPEQARGESHRVDRRTDVFSLGVILFELLTGERPFRGNTRMLLHQLLTEDPPSPRKFSASIPRDLETICLKAIAKEPAGRYETADALAQDLHRFIRDEPIQARPAGPLGKAWRWCRRNPVVSGLTVGLVLVLLAGLTSVSSLWLTAEYHRGRFEAERDQALREKQRADENFQQARQAVDEYFVKVSENPVLKTQLLPLRKQLLESALKYYTDFVRQRADDPQLQMELALSYLRVGQITAEIGSQEEAIQSYQKALEILLERQRTHPTNVALREHLAFCHYQMGSLFAAMDRHDEARLAMQSSLQLRQQLLKEHPDDRTRKLELADSYNGVAIAAARRYEPDTESLQEAVDILQTILRQDPQDHSVRNRLGGMLNSVATAHMMQDQFDEAERWLNEAIGQQRQAVEQKPSEEGYQEFLGNQLFNQGQLYMQMRAVEKARAAYQEAHQIHERLARTNPALVNRQVQLARACIAIANVADADEQARRLTEARDILQRLSASNPALANGFLAQVYNRLALRSYAAGDHPAAIDHWLRCGELLAQELKRDPINRENHLRNLARCHLYLCHVRSEKNEAQAALESGEQARELYQQLLVAAPDHRMYRRRMAETCNELGLLHLAAGRLDDAEQMFDRAIMLNEKLIKQQPHDMDLLASAGGACCNLGNVFNERELAQEALKWYARADERLSEILSGQPEHPVARQYMANTLISRMSVLHELQRYDDELRDCQRAIRLTAGDQLEALKGKEAELQDLLSDQEAP